MTPSGSEISPSPSPTVTLVLVSMNPTVKTTIEQQKTHQNIIFMATIVICMLPLDFYTRKAPWPDL